MSNRPDLIDSDGYKRMAGAMAKHAEDYKRMFHDMQEAFWEAEKRMAAQRRIMAKQREVIRRLEQRLGIDQEL